MIGNERYHAIVSLLTDYYLRNDPYFFFPRYFTSHKERRKRGKERKELMGENVFLFSVRRELMSGVGVERKSHIFIFYVA